MQPGHVRMEWSAELRQQVLHCFQDRAHAAYLFKKMSLLQQIADGLQSQVAS